MKRAQTLERRLESLGALCEAVSAMKALASHHFRGAREALGPARAYRQSVEESIAAIDIGSPPKSSAPAAILLLAADLGLCGNYTSRLAQKTVELYRERKAGRLYCVGNRSFGVLRRAGLSAARVYRAPAAVDGLLGLLLALADELFGDYLSGRFGTLDVVSGRFEGVGSFRPTVSLVLPIGPVRKSVPLRPSEYVSPLHLEEIAVREFLYITLYELLLEALASEHGMRIVATESAEEWLDERITDTEHHLSSVRREDATQEVLDLAYGARRRADRSR